MTVTDQVKTIKINPGLTDGIKQKGKKARKGKYYLRPIKT